MFWRGTAAVQSVAKTNPLVASYSDPDVVSFRNDLLAEFRDELSARRAGIDVQLDTLLPLLWNRFLFGVIFTSPQTGTSSGSPQQPEDEAAAQALFHFAVAPGMASRENVRHAAERLQTGVARETATLAANPDFRRVRSLLPGAVSVFSFAGNRRVDWPAVITQ